MLLNDTGEEGKSIERKEDSTKTHRKKTGRYNPEEKSKELIQNVDKICKMRGISRYTLAKGADISTSTIHSLLAGKTKPYMYTVYKLCNALDIPISDLLIEPCDETIENISKEEQELLMLYRKCTPSKRHLLKVYLQMLTQFQEKF